jgi:hypothetical protein
LQADENYVEDYPVDAEVDDITASGKMKDCEELGQAVNWAENKTLIYISTLYKETFGLRSIYSKTHKEFVKISNTCETVFPYNLTMGEVQLSGYCDKYSISIAAGNDLFKIVESILPSQLNNDYSEENHRTYRTVRDKMKLWCEQRYTTIRKSYVEWPEHWKMSSCEPPIPKIEMHHLDLYESVQLLLANPDIMLNDDYRKRIMLRAEETWENLRNGEKTRCVSHLMTG